MAIVEFLLAVIRLATLSRLLHDFPYLFTLPASLFLFSHLSLILSTLTIHY